MKRVSNSDARSYVNSLSEFKTNNETMFARRLQKCYAVYSYGHHFPMYVYDYESQTWIGNKDKYSRTTSAHQSKARPSERISHWFDTRTLCRIIDHGLSELIAKRMEQ